ncbi:secretin N-terminal domain-containing protein [Achromobacter insuavis]
MGNEGVLLNFVDADIPAVLRVLARYTGRHFLVDARVKGTLTLQVPVAPDTAYGMLLGALRMQGFAAVDVAGGTRVVPEADAKLQGGPVANAGAPADGAVVTRTFRLSYENAAALVPVLRPMIAPNNPITAYPANNTLVITDYADNLDRIGRIIASIDNPSSLVTEVVKIRQGIAVDIAGMASELLDTQQGGDPSQRVAVVADPRANSVILRSSSPARQAGARPDPAAGQLAERSRQPARGVSAQRPGHPPGQGAARPADGRERGAAAGGDAAMRAALSAGGGLGAASTGANASASGGNATAASAAATAGTASGAARRGPATARAAPRAACRAAPGARATAARSRPAALRCRPTPPPTPSSSPRPSRCTAACARSSTCSISAAPRCWWKA